VADVGDAVSPDDHVVGVNHEALEIGVEHQLAI
jgi:hypothetical protein